MSDWQAFWGAVAIFIIAEATITLHGIDTLLWKFKTPAELAIQQKLGRSCTP